MTPYSPQRPAWLLWFVWLALLTGAALASRGVIPLDETRYLSVAWEMWLRGDFLVPYKNGAPYSHKAPLLFWMIHGGWFVFGVNEWWPRLLAPLLALANTWMTWRLVRRFWPAQAEIAHLAPLVLLSSLLWMVYAQALMFDMLITTCALMGLNALAGAALSGNPRHWLGFGLAIGLGLLAKGPAILVHLLPVALLAPWWAHIGNRKRWYGAILLALLLGAAMALVWAIPAGLRGGEEYRQAIFWGQTANRMVNSFAHKLPFWWYLAALPLFFFPWLAWPSLWRRIPGALKTGMAESGVRFTLIWCGAGLLIFSAISGKQPHYILPEAPALAILIAYTLTRSPPIGRPLLPALGLLALGTAFLWASLSSAAPPSLSTLSPWAGAGFALAGLTLLPKREGIAALHWLSGVMMASMMGLLLLAFRPLAPAFDMGPVSAQLARLEAQGRPIANLGKYHGQFHFAGRLQHPIDALHSTQEVHNWIGRNPQGVLIRYFPRDADLNAMPHLFAQPYRSGWVALVMANEAEVADEAGDRPNQGAAANDADE
jgi:4-amino-4-deoxy-L-arabinose transferase-like glycosyltransferase